MARFSMAPTTADVGDGHPHVTRAIVVLVILNLLGLW